MFSHSYPKLPDDQNKTGGHRSRHIVLVCCRPRPPRPPPPYKNMDRQLHSRSVLMSCSVTSSSSHSVRNVTVTKTVKTVTVIRRSVITTAALDPVVFRAASSSASGTFRHTPYVRSRRSDFMLSDARHQTTATRTKRIISHCIPTDQRIRIPNSVNNYAATGFRQGPVPVLPLPHTATSTGHANWPSHWNRTSNSFPIPVKHDTAIRSQRQAPVLPLPHTAATGSSKPANNDTATGSWQRPVPVSSLSHTVTHTGHTNWPSHWNRLVTGQMGHKYKQTGETRQGCGLPGQK